MKTLLTGLIAGAVILATASHARAVPIQWTIGSGGNDHYYDYVSTPLPSSWLAAEAAANGSTHLGLPGHLATLTSAPENTFVYAAFGLRGYIGLYQPPGSPEPAGGWTWVTGEAFLFANWDGGEPNNFGAGEAHAEMGQIGASSWNDIFQPSPFTPGYYVEYEPAAAVPEPGTALLLVSGLAGLALARRRRRG